MTHQEILDEIAIAITIASEKAMRHFKSFNETFERIARLLAESDIPQRLYRAGLTMKPDAALRPKPLEPIDDLTDEHIGKVAEIIGASRPVTADMLNQLRQAHDNGIAGIRYGQPWQALSKMHQKGAK